MTEERVFVVPEDRGPGRGRLVRPPHRRPGGVRGRRRAYRHLRASGADGAGLVVQAGHPVPRPARRRSVFPDAADRGGRGRPAARPVFDRGGRSPEPGRRRPARWPSSGVGRGARGVVRPRVRARRRSSTTTRPRSAPSTSARCTSPTPGAGPVAIRETDKLTGAFATRAEVEAVADRLETWSQLAFAFLESKEGAGVR